MKKLYISGPISGHNIEERKETFSRMKEMLERDGYEVFNPMENGLEHDAPTKEHMKRDLLALLDCDCIYMLAGWNHSAGCLTELHVATACGLSVKFEGVSESVTFK